MYDIEIVEQSFAHFIWSMQRAIYLFRYRLSCDFLVYITSHHIVRCCFGNVPNCPPAHSLTTGPIYLYIFILLTSSHIYIYLIHNSF